MPKLPTYTKARGIILNALESEGWKVSKHLKIPHATDPSGELQIWFKKQSMQVGPASRPAGFARSSYEDMREIAVMEPSQISSFLAQSGGAVAQMLENREADTQTAYDKYAEEKYGVVRKPGG